MHVNTNAIRNGVNNRKMHLMKKLREYDFAIFETVEFLDTHPCNIKALKYYSKLREEREKVLVEYEASFGPITMYGNKSDSSWDWVKGPWPWEGEC